MSAFCRLIFFNRLTSAAEALRHAGYHHDVHVKIHWIDSENITADNAGKQLSGLDGILVPGGFGSRGIEGMIVAARYARENVIPYFGICLGMQIAVIEFARNVLGYADANSGEFSSESKHTVIDLMPDQHGNIPKGGTMRLGAYPCKIKSGSMLERAYKTDFIKERHRHRYEFSNQYKEEMEANGMIITGNSPDGLLAEAVEIPDKRFFVGVQYHPEFKSRPNRAHPLFRELIAAALEQKEKNK